MVYINVLMIVYSGQMVTVPGVYGRGIPPILMNLWN